MMAAGVNLNIRPPASAAGVQGVPLSSGNGSVPGPFSLPNSMASLTVLPPAVGF